MIQEISKSMSDLKVQGRRFLGSADRINDMSPTRKKTKRLPSRSKSLVDTSSNNSRSREGVNPTFFHSSDVNRNVGRLNQAYLMRAPTQDDIYKILDETSDIIRPTTTAGESKRLSPYMPLPAIGNKLKTQVVGSEMKQRHSTSIPDDSVSKSDSVPKLIREGTYNVLQPKYVKGPIEKGSQDNEVDNKKKEKRRKKDKVKEIRNQLKSSSTTIMFGPRLPKAENDITEEDLTEVSSEKGKISQTSKTGEKELLSQGNDIKIQKLYYRDDDAEERPKVQKAFWFEF